jgi:glycosyltransferase involved in cell wall biosynthesis
MTAERTLLNLLPVRVGGGFQNAASFLKSIPDSGSDAKRWFALVRGGSPLTQLCEGSNIPFLASRGSSNFARLQFELFRRHTFDAHKVCLTLFGPPPLGSFGRVVNVVGCAYSNLFYPEISFRSGMPTFERAFWEFVDVGRRMVTEHADHWVFETDTLRKRAVECCRFPEERVSVVRMAPSLLVSKSKVNPDRSKDFAALLPGSFRLLLLCDPNPNKRVHMVPRIAKEMIQMGFKDFSFVLTLNEVSAYTRAILAEVERSGLTRHVVNLGPITHEDVPSLIDACDVMCTFSVLESFSNNFVEAWIMQKPLVVTDADWARDSCGEAAVYVDPASRDASATMVSLARDAILRMHLVAQGSQQLMKMNTPKTKLEAYVKVLERALASGPMSRESRKRIRWQ